MAADWDPFLDPADTVLVDSACSPLKHDLLTANHDAGLCDAPSDPWNDNTFVSLAKEAAREAREKYEAALQQAREQEAEEEQQKKEQEARRQKAEQEAREFAKLSPEERKKKLADRQVYADMAMDAILQAPAYVASRGRDRHDLETASQGREEDDMRLGRAAASIAAADMGIKISFKTKKEAMLPVGLLFPDQGSKSLRMLKGLQEFPEARRLREASRDILGYDPLEGPGFQGFYELLRGNHGWLEHTQYCQPAMYVTQVAAIEKLRAKRPGALQRCQAVAGLSLGDYAALTFSGVWDFETGLRAVQMRGEVMEAAASQQAMLSVAGLKQEHVEALCAECRKEHDGVCQIAQHLFLDGFVCAGSASCIQRLLHRARVAEGCKQVLLLDTTGAFHTSLMEPAREQLLELLKSFETVMRPPKVACPLMHYCPGRDL
eukprot:TRINITY_DN66700_c0_g1_i1.p1 TRINITY_DN66700_c0_g1~~TRINITY_DN66700_c0_g1_i1.p1  ORF type:complete len:452 (+),score=114.72 TRINITY_DN66700_c0_g1_i1:56-1357(+)